MDIAFTICSNNYLAQASVLAESFKHFNPKFYFAIILIDEFSTLVNYEAICADEIIPLPVIDQYGLKELF